MEDAVHQKLNTPILTAASHTLLPMRPGAGFLSFARIAFAGRLAQSGSLDARVVAPFEHVWTADRRAKFIRQNVR